MCPRAAAGEQLADLVERMRVAVRADDRAGMVEPDMRFHELLLERADQPQSLQIWRTIQPRVRAYFRRDASYYADPHAVGAQHRVLLDALIAGDQDAGRRAISEHIRTHFGDPSASRHP